MYRKGSTPETVIHPLDFENIADIIACIQIVSEIKKIIATIYEGSPNPSNDNSDYEKVQKEIKAIVTLLPNLDCLPETIQKMSKVTIPDTDY
jgi:hypothetical protein